MNGAIIEKEKEAGLRVIGLCELYGRRQVRGSEAAAHAQRMLLLYRLSYWRRFGRSATQDEVRQAMWRRAMEMQGEAVDSSNSGYVENSCNGYYHDPAYHKGANMHKQKGGRSAGGNPRAKMQHSHVPTNLPSHATDGQLARLLKKGLDAVDAHKGNQIISRGTERYKLTQKGSDHRKEHQKQKVDNEQVAKALTQGDFEKSGNKALAYHKNTKVIKQNKTSLGADITTAYHETEYRNTYKKGKPRT